MATGHFQISHMRAPPLVDAAGKMPLHHHERRAALALGFGREQVGQALHRIQVHAAMAEGAARKLAGLRAAQARHRPKRRLHRGDDRAPPMAMQLHHILARYGGRTRQPQYQRAVERHGVLRVAQQGEARLPRRRYSAGQGEQGGPRLRAAHPDDPDAGGRRAAGQREDAIPPRHA